MRAPTISVMCRGVAAVAFLLGWAAACDGNHGRSADAGFDGHLDAISGAEAGAPGPEAAITPQGHCPSGPTFDDTTGKVVFSAMIDGKGPFQVAYDSGAPTSVFAPKVTGKGIGLVSTVTTIDLGEGLVLGPVQAYTSPLPEGIPFDGLIGNDAIGARVLTLDYGRKRIWVREQIDEPDLLACDHVSGKPERLALEVAKQGHVYAQGKIEGLPGYLLVDSGASYGGVYESVLKQAGKDNPAVEGYWLEVFIGTFWSSFTMVKKVSAGPYSVERIVMFTMPDGVLPTIPSGATLGTLPFGFLRNFLVTIDFPGRVMRLDAVKDATMKGGFVVYGYGLSLSTDAGGPVTITRVIPGSAADHAGLKPGSEVVRIGSVDPATVNPKERIYYVLTEGPGTKRTFVVQDGARSVSHELLSSDVFEGVP